jgi:hypothetical protein
MACTPKLYIECDLPIKNGLAERVEDENCPLLKPRGARLPLPQLRELGSIRGTMEGGELQIISAFKNRKFSFLAK